METGKIQHCEGQERRTFNVSVFQKNTQTKKAMDKINQNHLSKNQLKALGSNPRTCFFQIWNLNFQFKILHRITLFLNF